MFIQICASRIIVYIYMVGFNDSSLESAIYFKEDDISYSMTSITMLFDSIILIICTSVAFIPGVPAGSLHFAFAHSMYFPTKGFSWRQ